MDSSDDEESRLAEEALQRQKEEMERKLAVAQEALHQKWEQKRKEKEEEKRRKEEEECKAAEEAAAVLKAAEEAEKQKKEEEERRKAQEAALTPTEVCQLMEAEEAEALMRGKTIYVQQAPAAVEGQLSAEKVGTGKGKRAVKGKDKATEKEADEAVPKVEWKQRCTLCISAGKACVEDEVNPVSMEFLWRSGDANCLVVRQLRLLSSKEAAVLLARRREDQGWKETEADGHAHVSTPGTGQEEGADGDTRGGTI